MSLTNLKSLQAIALRRTNLPILTKTFPPICRISIRNLSSINSNSDLSESHGHVHYKTINRKHPLGLNHSDKLGDHTGLQVFSFNN